MFDDTDEDDNSKTEGFNLNSLFQEPTTPPHLKPRAFDYDDFDFDKTLRGAVARKKDNDTGPLVSSPTPLALNNRTTSEDYNERVHYSEVVHLNNKKNDDIVESVSSSFSSISSITPTTGKSEHRPQTNTSYLPSSNEDNNRRRGFFKNEDHHVYHQLAASTKKEGEEANSKNTQAKEPARVAEEKPKLPRKNSFLLELDKLSDNDPRYNSNNKKQATKARTSSQELEVFSGESRNRAHLLLPHHYQPADNNNETIAKEISGGAAKNTLMDAYIQDKEASCAKNEKRQQQTEEPPTLPKLKSLDKKPPPPPPTTTTTQTPPKKTKENNSNKSTAATSSAVPQRGVTRAKSSRMSKDSLFDSTERLVSAGKRRQVVQPRPRTIHDNVNRSTFDAEEVSCRLFSARIHKCSHGNDGKSEITIKPKKPINVSEMLVRLGSKTGERIPESCRISKNTPFERMGIANSFAWRGY